MKLGSPDYVNRDGEEAAEDFLRRIECYESSYESLDEDLDRWALRAGPSPRPGPRQTASTEGSCSPSARGAQGVLGAQGEFRGGKARSMVAGQADGGRSGAQQLPVHPRRDCPVHLTGRALRAQRWAVGAQRGDPLSVAPPPSVARRL